MSFSLVRRVLESKLQSDLQLACVHLAFKVVEPLEPGRTGRNGDGKTVTISVEDLAERTGSSERTTRITLQMLEALNVITVIHRGSGRGSKSRYFFNREKLEQVGSERHSRTDFLHGRQLGKGADSAPFRRSKAADSAGKGAGFADKGCRKRSRKGADSALGRLPEQPNLQEFNYPQGKRSVRASVFPDQSVRLSAAPLKAPTAKVIYPADPRKGRTLVRENKYKEAK